MTPEKESQIRLQAMRNAYEALSGPNKQIVDRLTMRLRRTIPELDQTSAFELLGSIGMKIVDPQEKK